MSQTRQADESWHFFTLLPKRKFLVRQELESLGLSFEFWHDQIVAINRWPLASFKPAGCWHRAPKVHLLKLTQALDLWQELIRAGHRFLYLPHNQTHELAWPWVKDLPKLSRRIWDPLKPLPHFYPISLITLLPDKKWLVLENLYPPWDWGIYWKKWPQAPSRAYLKLLEAWMFVSKKPNPTDQVLEAGSAPGGWTYALLRLNAHWHIHCWDKAPMAPFLAQNPRVTWYPKDFYKAIQNPKILKLDQFQWFFCDMALKPRKIFHTINTILEQNPNIQFVATVKMTEDDPELRNLWPKFHENPATFVHHLYHNKHEFTWFKLQNPRWFRLTPGNPT